MIDSTNPRQLADNIRKLWDKFKSISGDLLPSRSTATTGQILKLTGENKTPSWADEYSYTPPAITNNNEYDTGMKFDGKNLFALYNVGQTPSESGTFYLHAFPENISVIDLSFFILTSGNYYSQGGVNVYRSGNTFYCSISSSTTNLPFSFKVYYTKPDPAPETRDDDTEPEPEEKKTTKKKTNK